MGSKVKDLLDLKGYKVFSITRDETVYDAIKVLADKNLGAVLVIENQILYGIVSERDYARKVVLHGKSSKETKVSDIMSTKVRFVKPDDSIDECMALMTEQRIRHLPVMQNDKIVGIISIGDVVKSILADKNYQIKQLEEYIHG